jgi:hypothetical protein
MNWLVPLLLLCCHFSFGQILLDQGISADGLVCFPKVEDPTKFQYLPQSARLAKNSDGTPQFSMLRYVKNVSGDASSTKSITQAEGGAIVSFLMEYHTEQSLIDNAGEIIADELGIDAKIIGPVNFLEGSYAIISSTLLNDAPENQLLATGIAPITEGGKIALSFELTPERSKLLLESFKTKTPDISVVFDLKYEGLLNGYKANVKVHWDDIQKHKSWQSQANLVVVNADASKSIDSFVQSNSVEIEVLGDDAAMEGILELVHTKVMDFLYEPVSMKDLEKKQEKNEPGQYEQIANALTGKSLIPKIGASLAYQQKTIKQEGTSTISLNKKSNAKRYHLITDNIGNIYSRFGSNEKFFKTINLDDPDFAQREIKIGVDGDLEPAFKGMVNSVVVTLKKNHENGETTIDELVLNAQNFNTIHESGLIYGRKGDVDSDSWMNYDYVSNWSLRGGVQVVDTTKQNSAMITLALPYYSQEVLIIGDSQVLEEADVRVAVVEISYDFFGEKKKSKVNIKPGAIEDQSIQLIQPNGSSNYDVNITWFSSDGKKTNHNYVDNSGIVFYDIVPLD